MPRKAKQVISGLEGKGFVRRDGKDIFLHLYVDDKKTPIFTKVSHGEKEIHDGLLGAMSKQLRLSKKQFGQLIDCPLSEEGYIESLCEDDHIE